MADAEYNRSSGGSEYYRAFTQSTSDSLYRLSADGTELIEVHGSLLRRHDRDAESDIDWLEDYVHPNDREMVHEAWTKAVRNGDLYELEHRGKLADGSWGWVLSRAMPIRNAKGEVSEWIGTATDITGNKHREQLLVEQKRLLELIASGAPVDDCLTSLCGAVQKLNSGVRASILLADEQRQTIQHPVAPDFLPSFGQELENALINDLIGICGEAILYGKPVTCRDIANDDRCAKPWRDLFVAHDVLACHSVSVPGPANQPIALFMLCFDEPREPNKWEHRLADFGAHVASVVFERDRANRALSESEKKYRTLFESMNEGFCIVEMLFDEDNIPVDYRFLEVNPAFEKQTGIRDVQGKTMRQIAPDHEEHWFETYGRVALTGKPVHFENPAIKLGQRWYNVYAFRSGPPENRHVAILFNDISKRKQAEEKLQTMNETLEERVEERTATLLSYQEQLRSLVSQLGRAEEQERRRLAANLHDNLGQMLAVCKMKLDLLQKNGFSNRAASGMAEVRELMDEAIRYTRELMSDLKPPPELDKKDLKAVVEWVTKKMKKHGLAVTIEDDGRPKPLSEEIRIMLLQSVRELLFNVVKHARVGKARVILSRPEEQVQVAVEDEGRGFDPAKEEPVPTEDGGFGLFNIRERIDLLGGSLEIISEPEKGTKVILRAPLESADESGMSGRGEEETGRPVSGQTKSGHKIKVLLADDHRMVRKGLRKMIEEQDDLIVIAEASNGKDAVKLARETSPDVIVMDVNMPGMNGVDATRQIMADAPHIHIIGLSLHEQENVVRSMRNAGASVYLTKDEAVETLCATIRSEAVIGN